METSLARLTQPSRDRAAALEKKVATLTTMLKAMKGSAMPRAVLAFFSASRSAPPCSTGSPPWQASATEFGAAPAWQRARRCDIVLARRFGVAAPMLALGRGRAFCPEPAVVPAQGGHDGRRVMPPPAVARQRQREQGRGLLPWPEGSGSSFSCLPPGSRLLAVPSLGGLKSMSLPNTSCVDTSTTANNPDRVHRRE